MTPQEKKRSQITKATRGSRPLTWDEIRAIERDWKSDEGPERDAITKLIRMIRFQAGLINRLKRLLKGEP